MSFIQRLCLAATAVFLRLTCGLGLVLAGPLFAADLRLMVEPFYTPQQSREVYQPLVSYLARKTGHNIELVTPRNYHFYWRDVRQNVAVDLMLAEPPITDYRIQRFGADPLVRTAEPTRYALLASDRLENPSLESLYGRNIASMPTPSLGFALLIEYFPNPVSQPNIQSSAASWRDGIEIVFSGDADATIVPTWLQQEYPNLIPLRVSREWPGIALSASAGLDAKVKEELTAALLELHEDPAAYEVINELRITRFERASAAEYLGAERMLSEFFGYR